MAKRREFADQFKAQVALEALRGDLTDQEIATEHQMHPNQASTWERQAVEGIADVFARGGMAEGPSEADVKDLHAKVGRLAVETDFCPPDSSDELRREERDDPPERVRNSMGSRGRCMDHIFIERLWRSLKQEVIYLEELTGGFKAYRIIREWMAFYNTERPHSALERQTPREADWAGRDQKLAA
ncbi:integrase core domain-containing protein [Microbaculum marinisediminis]|uniref:Integrase core domain-containing protein n=1 Tax=Microbaculum marinisediminis TaxID=2931392 RepID=A0AAW5QXX0_9HYPH|nr:integrase core domain-containing protein [Microbaculum sp. A6E488]MCT8971802.1 integrase core domain-containing protein [Microbaculum sp. A6E488]